MPNLRQTSATVRPLARSRSASRSRRAIWSAVRRLLMRPSWTYPIQIGTLTTGGPVFGEQPSQIPKRLRVPSLPGEPPDFFAPSPPQFLELVPLSFGAVSALKQDVV